jgi:hypothetical protein
LINRYRSQIEAALGYEGGNYSFDDVVAMVNSGVMQLWTRPQSVAITTINVYPQRKTLHFFIAGGNLSELENMLPEIETWAKAQGCTGATLLGRPGWERTFLARKGWTRTAVLMETTYG